MKNLLATAIALAADKHRNQFDNGGNPYILHPLKVMHYLKTDDMELMAIAVLHDVVEDCHEGNCIDGMTPAVQEMLGHEMMYRALLEHYKMSHRVVNALRLLTKRKGQTAEEYLEGIKTNPDAIKVKMADLRHNMDIRRLKGVTEKDAARLDKYAKMYTILKGLI